MKEEAGRDRIGDFVDDVLELISGASNWDREDLSALKERVQGGAQRLKETAAEREQQLREVAESAAARADSYAHENPWHVAAIAGALGLALGVLISRR